MTKPDPAPAIPREGAPECEECAKLARSEDAPEGSIAEMLFDAFHETGHFPSCEKFPCRDEVPTTISKKDISFLRGLHLNPERHDQSDVNRLDDITDKVIGLAESPASRSSLPGAPSDTLTRAERELVEKYRGWAVTGETTATTDAGVFLTYAEFNRLQSLAARASGVEEAMGWQDLCEAAEHERDAKALAEGEWRLIRIVREMGREISALNPNHPEAIGPIRTVAELRLASPTTDTQK